MDSDFWTSRLAAAKRQYNLQHRHQTSHLDRLTIDDFEVDDEVRPDFPCPYCYEDFDIASLCSHLEDDHPCESKVTICPVCYVKVARDMLNYLQRRCRLRRVAIPNSQALSLLGRDLREAHLQVLLGGGAYRSSGVNVSNANAATDSFLSSLIMNFPASEAEEITKSVVTSFDDTTTKNMAPAHMWKSSLDPSLSYEEREKRIRQATGRAGFVQDLLLTTLLND
ncbi:dehydration-induced 19 [Gossypium arboreum]|uniref:Dehydration-induced 19 n=1 Tax=Gossypium arboreum TaxID=29729 RepID=A0A0B0N551_GOSAR|nr:dehydration-induced 19 [Gossypium arboreum]